MNELIIYSVSADFKEKTFEIEAFIDGVISNEAKIINSTYHSIKGMNIFVFCLYLVYSLSLQCQSFSSLSALR